MNPHGGETGYVPPPGDGYASSQAGVGPTAPAPPVYASVPRRRRGQVLLAAGVVLAVLLAAAALVVSLARAPVSPSPPTAAAQQPASTTDADRSLCQAVAPLMAESDKVSNSYVDIGPAGTPARDAATPKFVADTQDWARRIQQVLDAHTTTQTGSAVPEPFLSRSLQRYIDDMRLFVASVRPGGGTRYDDAAWTDGIVAYGGPLSVCQSLGVKW